MKRKNTSVVLASALLIVLASSLLWWAPAPTSPISSEGCVASQGYVCEDASLFNDPAASVLSVTLRPDQELSQTNFVVDATLEGSSSECEVEVINDFIELICLFEPPVGVSGEMVSGDLRAGDFFAVNLSQRID